MQKSIDVMIQDVYIHVFKLKRYTIFDAIPFLCTM